MSDVEAGGFPGIVDSNPKLAFMSASASTELAGGPDAIAEEVAREAELEGTLIVLVGTKLGAWSSDVGDERLAELVLEARSGAAGGSPAAMVESLVRSVQAESTSGTPWGWMAAAIAIVGIGSVVVLDRLSRRRPQPSR